MGERQLEQFWVQPESRSIDEIYRLKNQRSDLQAELDCLSVDQEGNKNTLTALRRTIDEIDAKIKHLESLIRAA